MKWRASLLEAVPSLPPKVMRKRGNVNENLTLMVFYDFTLLKENIE